MTEADRNAGERGTSLATAVSEQSERDSARDLQSLALDQQPLDSTACVGRVPANVPGSQPSGETPTSGRDDRGRFAAGNAAALTHGTRSARVQAGLLPQQAEAAALLAEREASIVADLGGVEVLSAVAAGQARRHVRLELLEDFCWQNVLAGGVFTAKGRQRAAVSLLLTINDKLQRSASALGLERKARRVPTVEDYLREPLNAKDSHD